MPDRNGLLMQAQGIPGGANQGAIIDGLVKSQNVTQSRKRRKGNMLVIAIKNFAPLRLCAKKIVFTDLSLLKN